MTTDINKDRVHDSDNSLNFGDKLNQYNDVNYGGINKDNAYDGDNT